MSRFAKILIVVLAAIAITMTVLWLTKDTKTPEEHTAELERTIYADGAYHVYDTGLVNDYTRMLEIMDGNPHVEIRDISIGFNSHGMSRYYITYKADPNM